MSEKYDEQGIKVCCENCGMGKDRCTADKICHSMRPFGGFRPSVPALKARIAELTAFVREVGSIATWIKARSYRLENPYYDKARALLHGESGKGK